MRRLPRHIVILIVALAPPSAPAVELKFTMTQGAHAFAATLGPQCLTDEHASIEASGSIVTVNDEPGCAKEIREIAENWVLYAADPIVSLTGTPAALSMVRERLQQRFGKSPNQGLRFLARTQTCHCLAFVGKKVTEASALADDLLPYAAKGVQEKTTIGSDPLLPDRLGPSFPLGGRSQDLIDHFGPESAAPPGV